nr:serine/arginine repetitive matrix protein 3 [Zonotrichia albicollis]
MALYNNGADVPSPQEASNGFPQPGASGTWHKGEEEVRLVEPSMVKKAHREILDHERKRRVELKCMELQEMMEEQGYSEEEIRQKVGTFRQMLMEKEGVLTREDQHGRQIVIENHHGADGEEYEVEYPAYGEGCLLQCDCSAECYREDSGHREYRLKRRSSSSTSPPPKKKKKKKSGHRRSRKKRKPGSERSCDSSSPIRKEKKKKTGKKHRRDRSESGSRKKRRHRSRSPKNKRKDKNKERKRSRSESPAWRSHRRSSCSSHSASLSSDDSGSKSPGRVSPKRRQDGPKGSSARSSRSPSSPSPQRSASPHQNGHKGSAQNGRHSHGAPLPEPSDVRRLFLDHSSLPCPPPSTGLPPCSLPPSFPTRSAPRPAQPEHTGEIWGAGCTLPALTDPALGARSPWGSQPAALGQKSGQPTGHPCPKATLHPVYVTLWDDGLAGQHHLPGSALGSAPP